MQMTLKDDRGRVISITILTQSKGASLTVKVYADGAYYSGMLFKKKDSDIMPPPDPKPLDKTKTGDPNQ